MRFGSDGRAQSTLVGAILLFAILIIAFSSYQAFVIPNQNAEVEFNHLQDVENDFVEFRTTFINSVGATEDRSVTFRLGTQYPARLIALNPPPVTGELQTTQEEEVTIEGDILDDNIDSVCDINSPTTRSLVYTPNYNEFRSPQSITYENTFVAREFSDGTVYGEQRLFQERANGNDRIDLLLLNESVSLSGQGTASFEISPSNRRTVEVEDPTITIPSEFDETEWRNEILADVPDEALNDENGNAITGAEDGPFEITIRFDGIYDVSCVGTEVEPEENGGENDINPQDIRLDDVSVPEGGGNRLVDVTFENNRETTSISRARINFYQGSNSGEATITETSTTLSIGGDFEDVNPSIALEGEETSTVQFEIGGSGTIEGDWFVLTLVFGDTQSSFSRQYFISIPGRGGG